LYVVSAGLGLVEASRTAPAYDVTVVANDSPLNRKLQSYGAQARDWWRALAEATSNQNPLAALVHKLRGATFFIALPSVYIEMVSEDLGSIAKQEATRMRIFTSPAGALRVPSALQRSVMPYDDRLEGTSRSGTRTDFAQRAMRHFVSDLQGAGLDLEGARRAVENSLQGRRPKEIPSRDRKSDEELAQLLRANWDRFRGNSSRLLRFLRDEALVACEQGRFRRLWLELRESKEAVDA
jgi:hypothetical protein